MTHCVCVCKCVDTCLNQSWDYPVLRRKCCLSWQDVGSRLLYFYWNLELGLPIEKVKNWLSEVCSLFTKII